MSWHPLDQQGHMELRRYDAERCPNGHHPSTVGKYVPVVELCETCQAVDMVQQQEKPGPGQHVVLVTVEEAERRSRMLTDLDQEA